MYDDGSTQWSLTILQYVLGVDFEIEESYKMLWLVSSDSQSTKNMDDDDDSEEKVVTPTPPPSKKKKVTRKVNVKSSA